MVGYDPVLAAIAPPLHTRTPLSRLFPSFSILSLSWRSMLCQHSSSRLPQSTKWNQGRWLHNCSYIEEVLFCRSLFAIIQDAVAIVCPNPAAKQNVPEIGELGESYGPN